MPDDVAPNAVQLCPRQLEEPELPARTVSAKALASLPPGRNMLLELLAQVQRFSCIDHFDLYRKRSNAAHPHNCVDTWEVWDPFGQVFDKLNAFPIAEHIVLLPKQSVLLFTYDHNFKKLSTMF